MAVMIRNFFGKYIDLMSVDLRKSTQWDVEFNPVYKFTYRFHNFEISVFTIIACLFYIDLVLLNNKFLKHIFSSDSNFYLGDFNEDHMSILFVVCFVLSILGGALGSIYYYIKEGGRTERKDLFSKLIINVYITSFFSLFTGPLAVILAFYGGYLLSVKGPEWLGLDRIPGFILIQIYLVMKSSALAGICSLLTFLNLFPFSTHPAKSV